MKRLRLNVKRYTKGNKTWIMRKSSINHSRRRFQAITWIVLNCHAEKNYFSLSVECVSVLKKKKKNRILYLHELVVRATQHLQESHGTPALAGKIRTFRTTVVAHRHRHRHTIARAMCDELASRRIGGLCRRWGGAGGDFSSPIPGNHATRDAKFFLR